MTHGTSVDARFSLNRSAVPYSFQEDVVLVAALHNRGKVPFEIAHLSDCNEVKLQLRGTGAALRETTTFIAQPGVAAVSSTVSLKPGQSVTYRLPLQRWFGSLPSGKHAARIEIHSASVNATSDWLDFEILAPKVIASAVGVSPAISPSLVHLAWVDASSTPHRLLRRDYGLIRLYYQPTADSLFTRVLVELPAESTLTSLAAPSSPPQSGDSQQWFAWTTPHDLYYAACKEGELLRAEHRPLNDEMELVGSVLTYPDPVAQKTSFSLLLTSRAGHPPRIMALDFDSEGKLLGTFELKPARQPGRIASTHLSKDERWVFWSEQSEPDGVRLMSAPIPFAQGFGAIEDLGAVRGQVQGLVARATVGKLELGILSTQATTPPSPAQEYVLSRLERRTAKNEKVRRLPIQVGKWRFEQHLLLADLALGDGTLFALMRSSSTDPASASQLLVLKDHRSAPVPLSLAADGRDSRILLMEDSVPFVLSFDPQRGFQTEFLEPSTSLR